MKIARSLLFVPGSRPERFAKAAATDADALILDLEDAVAPDGKHDARQAVASFLQNRGGARQQIVVRINPLSRVCGLEDLAVLASLDADYILVPKVESAAQIALVASVLDDARSRTRLAALIETAKGVSASVDIASAGNRLAFLMFGAADYAADLGQKVEAYRADFARSMIVNAAAAGGMVAIDSPFFSINQPDALAHDCAEGRALGFYGKAAIHPSQIPLIASAYAPTQEDRDYAIRILDAAPDGVGVLDGKMVDIAMVRWARSLV